MLKMNEFSIVTRYIILYKYIMFYKISWDQIYCVLFIFPTWLLVLSIWFIHWWWISLFFLCSSVHVRYVLRLILGTYKFTTVIFFWWIEPFITMEHLYLCSTFYVKVCFFWNQYNQTSFLLVSVYLAYLFKSLMFNLISCVFQEASWSLNW